MTKNSTSHKIVKMRTGSDGKVSAVDFIVSMVNSGVSLDGFALVDTLTAEERAELDQRLAA